MNSVIFVLGFIQIRWYSLLVLLAFIIGYLLVINRCKKKNISIALINDLCFYIVIFGILGARLYYCLFEIGYYSKHIIDIFKIWEGGLAIHGGIIAGLICVYIYSKKKKINLIEFLDIFAPALVIGQAIGRWGNFFNREAFGPATTIETLKSLKIPNFIIDGMYIDHAYHHPTFFYESLGCLLIFIILIIVRQSKKIKDGQIVSIYFVGYGILRFIIESLRQDSLMLLNFKMAQIISIIMILSGVILFIRPYIFKNEKNN